MSRLIIVSNRLPITVNETENGLSFYPSAGGLATGLNSLSDDREKQWIGWPGNIINDDDVKVQLTEDLKKDNLVPVFLTKEDLKNFYEGFSNKTIWPHFHYFAQFTSYRQEYWKSYYEVNKKFCDAVAQTIQPGDTVWVHDYQLMLLPAMIRELFPDISIGFFLHIPFPSYEIFRLLPWREEILAGLLGADQIGFHTFDYMRHFLSAVYRISGFEHNFGQLKVNDRTINVDVFPMGINYDKYAHPEKIINIEASDERIKSLLAKKRKLILSIDRLDYTKGIPHRLRAFEKFLKEHPEYHGKVTLMLMVVPSRANVSQYKELKNEVEKLVGRIDGKYRTFGWSPIQYFYRSSPFDDLMSLYMASDIAMITPLRDGMNLVAKEFVASKEQSKKGVLILSEFAGAAMELTDAIIVNPRDRQGMVDAMIKALEMPEEEQKSRLIKMQTRLKRYTVSHWANHFLNELMSITNNKKGIRNNLLTSPEMTTYLDSYKKANHRLILLDYDGTLMGFKNDPTKVNPDQQLLDVLKKLNSDKKNRVVIISGRDHHSLEEWLGDLNLEMSGEHGAWIKRQDGWQTIQGFDNQWKANIRPMLEQLVERTPRSFIEEKEYSLAWHYRNIDRDLGEKRVREFRDDLIYMTANLDLQVLEGNKVLEVKNSEINKGKTSKIWLNEIDWDFIMAIGDDHTDEDTFRSMPDSAFTIKVGDGETVARHHVPNVGAVRELLKKMAE